MPLFESLLAASAVVSGGGVRAASLDLCSDEYLLAVARDADIASLSRLASDPGDSAAWQRARRFASNKGTMESVIAARPTLVVAMGGGGRARGDIARALNMRIVDLPYPASPADVAANLVRLATALGDRARAAPWVRRIALTARPGPLMHDSIYLGGGGLSQSTSSLGAAWMARAGLVQRALPGGRATIEALRLHPPSILLQSDYRRGQLSAGQKWLDHPLLRSLGARRIVTDGRGWTCGGPALLPEIERLRRVVG